MDHNALTHSAGIDLPEPGWQPLPMPRQFGDGRSFVSGEPDGDRLRVHYYKRQADGALMAKVWFGLGAEGPPGHAHGGSMAAVLDEAMGFAAWVAGKPVVAASITIHFRKRLPLGRVLIVETLITSVAESKVQTTGRIFDPESGRVFCEGEGLFIEQSMDSFGALADNLRERNARAAARPASDSGEELR
jgi:hypothetical protein